MAPLCAMIKTCYMRRLLHLTHCLLFAGKRLCSLPCALLITIRNDGYSRVLAVDDDGPYDLNIECSELPYPVTSFASIMKRFVVRLNLLLKNRYALNCEICYSTGMTGANVITEFGTHGNYTVGISWCLGLN